MDRYEFIVSGQPYSIGKQAMLKEPASKLSELCKNQKDAGPLVFDRPPELFAAILSLYQTGTLHIPMSACPGAFLEEMEFWDIKQESLATCCFYRLQCFLNEQENLKKFRKQVFDDVSDDVSTLSMAMCSTLERVRRKVWGVLDYRDRTMLSRVYFMVALVMVLISIFTIACSTEPMFKRAMTNCERLEYMKSAGMEHLNLVSGRLTQNCSSEQLPFTRPTFKIPTSPLLLQNKFISDVPYETEEISDDYVYFDIDDIKVLDEVTQSTFTTTSDTYVARMAHDQASTPKVKIPNMKVQMYSLVILDILTLAFFTVEFVLRLISCPSILHYFFSIINATDAAALIGTYLHMLLMYLYKHEKYRDDWLDILEYMQMLRSLRLFRIVKNVRASRVLVYSVKKNIKDFSVLMLFLVVGMCTFASIVYIPENKENITSIPRGWYWAIVTMTTVGYGDVVPNTAIGKVIGCLCAIAGVLLFALTVPVFANNFVTFYQYAGLEAAMVKRQKKNKKRQSLEVKLYDFCEDDPFANSKSASV